MNKLIASLLLGFSAILFSGCIAIGNRDALRPNATLGQQLIDLQKARDTGAITDHEYQSQKSRLLNPK
jgi:hypothetical protein